MIALAVILSVVLVFFGLVIGTRELLRYGSYGAKETDVTCSEGRVEYYENAGGTPYLVKRLPSGELADDFKIISTTDMHLRGEFSEFTIEVLGRFIDKEKPDLVVLCGDNIVADKIDLSLQKMIRDLFEEKKTYWTFVLGNHDNESFASQYGEEGSRERAFLSLAEGSPYCIARNEGGENVYGSGNHVINIKNSSGIMQTLFFIDSGSMMIDEYCAEEGIENTHGYDFIKQNQIAWYRNQLKTATAENNGVTPKSMVFMHIAMLEYKTAWRHCLTFKKDAKRLYGDVWENFGCSDYSSGFFDALKEEGSTHTVVVGHDHVINTAVEYQGIRLTYSMPLSYEGYNRRHRCSAEHFLAFWNQIDKRACFYTDGVTAYKVKSDGQVDLMPKYAQFEGVFDGLEEQLEEVCAGNKTYNH